MSTVSVCGFQGGRALEGSRQKAELERECQIDASLFAEVTERMVEFMEPFLGSFSRRTQAGHATKFVQGLCSNLEAKNAESMAYLFRLDRKTLQHFVGESAWDDRPLRDELIRQVGEQLGEAEGVIAFDPSSFPKSGSRWEWVVSGVVDSARSTTVRWVSTWRI